MDKRAQWTRIDEMLEAYNHPQSGRSGENKQEALPLYDPEKKERHEKRKLDRTHYYSDYGKPQQQQDLEQWLNERSKPVPPPREPIDFNYPELRQEQIGVRQLNEHERARLQNEMSGVYERMVDNRTRKKDRLDEGDHPYYRAPWNNEKDLQKELSRLNEYAKLDKALPDDIKKNILAHYDEFRRTAAKFYVAYKEANEFALDEPELSYEGTYKDLVKEFAKFTMGKIKVRIGELFGHNASTSGTRGDKYGNQNGSAVVQALKKGIDIFSIHAYNYKSKIYEIQSLERNMRWVMDEYERMKKVLEKLPKRVNMAVNSFLRKKENRELLSWLDQYYPNEKEEFVNDSVARLLSSSDTKSREELLLGDLASFKVFKKIHDKAIGSSTEKLVDNIHTNVSRKIADDVYEHVIERLRPKLKYLRLVLESDDQFPDIARLLKKEYGIDLPSIFNFTNGIIDNYWDVRAKQEGEDLTRIEQEGELGRAEREARAAKNKFYTAFLAELKQNVDEFGGTSRQRDIISAHVMQDFLHKFDKHIYMHNLRKLPDLTSKDIDVVISNIMKELVVKSLPNFTDNRGYGNNIQGLPDFRAFGELIKQTGRFSVSDFTNVAHKDGPIVPKEFWFNVIKQLVKGTTAHGATTTSAMGGFESISRLKTMEGKTALEALVNVLKKTGKFTTDNFANQFKRYFDAFFGAAIQIRTEFRGLPETEQASIIANAIRNPDTIEQDAANLISFLNFKHNEASDIDTKTMRKILNNQNFMSFTKNGIARKLIKIYAAINSRGGPNAIYAKYGALIQDLIKRKFISRSFRSNMKLVFSFFNSNAEINPKSEVFNKLFETISSLETDLATIEMGDTLRDLVVHYEEKDKNLYALNLQINDRLRFRVLEGKDPRALRVGVETNCCQRIGGQAETVARDSFINKLAGILLLEWKDNEGKWVLVSQSYFHYVPKDNGYILDNVEKNSVNERASGVDLEAAYAYLGQAINGKLEKSALGPLGYFVAGKNYSKIDYDDFKSHRMTGGDPRSYSRAATSGTGKSRVYSDYDPRNSIDLLKPKANGMDVRMSTLVPETNTAKVAMDLRRSIFRAALVA